jgi:hypothetical protein
MEAAKGIGQLLPMMAIFPSSIPRWFLHQYVPDNNLFLHVSNKLSSKKNANFIALGPPSRI